MNQEQAIQIIKQVIDISLQSGVFKKLEDTTQVAIAFEVIASSVLQQSQAKSNKVSEIPVPAVLEAGSVKE